MLLFLVVGMSGCGQKIVNRHSDGKNIICFGDSITEGVGAGAGEDYPAQLSQQVVYPVINAGKRGETSRDALKRLKNDVLDQDPFLVIVQFNANDSFQQIPLTETLDNLTRIVTAIQACGAMVVLVEVRTGIFNDEYDNGFKDIARKHAALLIPDILKGILFDPALKSDGIHPNAGGYRIVAGRVLERISPLLDVKRRN